MLMSQGVYIGRDTPDYSDRSVRRGDDPEYLLRHGDLNAEVEMPFCASINHIIDREELSALRIHLV